MLSKHAKDLTGYRSGWLEVISYVEGSGGSNKHTRWLCYCHRCGNYTEVESGHLTSSWRPIMSCGCLRTNPVNTTLEDLTGKKYGFLLVESLAKHGRKNRHAQWNCLCVCGRHAIATSAELKQGRRISCGCKAMSKGELIIYNLLMSTGIYFETQVKLRDIITSAGGHPRMDFAFFEPDKKTIKAFLEYQGELHYIDTGDFAKTVREETDPMKQEYCYHKNIPLYEIKYTDNIPQTLTKILLDLKLIPCQAP